MNARTHRVKLNLSPLDFPSIMGLGQSTVAYRTEPPYMANNNVVLAITNQYILIDMDTNKENEVLTVQSVYEIPPNEIKSREDVYEFYKDALLGLNEAFQYVGTQLPTLPRISFPNQPIETYQREIDSVFNLLNSRN